MDNKFFRTRVFGGYNKEDVQSYINRLEAELARMQAQPSAVQQDSSNIGEDESKAILEKEDMLVLEEVPEQQEEAVLQKSPGTGEDKVSDESKQKQTDMELELKDLHNLCEQQEKRLQMILTENQQLTGELEKLQEERENYEKDYKALKDVLLNARVDAEIIVTKAKREAQLIIDKAHKQISQQKKESVDELMHQLHYGLQASKYSLEEHVKSIERTERQIKVIQDKMEDFLETDNEETFEA